MKYVIYKHFGKYKITTKENYDDYCVNLAKVVHLFDCHSFKEAFNAAINNGWKAEDIINETGEE